MELEFDSTQQQADGYKQLDEYLASAPTRDKNPFLFWEAHGNEYPGLAQMAKDFLSVPVSGVGVEHAFSQGRIICHYLQNQLYSETIKQLMVLRQHWGLQKKEKLGAEGEKKRASSTDKESYTYGKKDFDIALQAQISDNEDGPTISRYTSVRTISKRPSARASKRKT